MRPHASSRITRTRISSIQRHPFIARHFDFAERAGSSKSLSSFKDLAWHGMALACESQDKASLVFSSFCTQTQFPKSLQSQSYKVHNVLVHACSLSPLQTATFKSPANSQCKLLPAQDLCISAGKFRCRKCSPISESAGSTAALTPVALECGCDTFKIIHNSETKTIHLIQYERPFMKTLVKISC